MTATPIDLDELDRLLEEAETVSKTTHPLGVEIARFQLGNVIAEMLARLSLKEMLRVIKFIIDLDIEAGRKVSESTQKGAVKND